MTWKERLIGIPLALAGAVLLVATASGMMFTRTDWGRERVRQFALEKLNEAIAGRVEINEVLEGDLLRTVRMAGVRIFEPDGSEFARIDTVAVHYRWSDFLFGNITFPKVTLIGPVANLRTTRGEGWNFERLFGGREAGPADSTTAPSEGGRGRRVVLREVDIRSGDVTLRFPWDPRPGSDPDSSAWHLEEVDGRWERVVRVERLNANLPTARVAAPEGQSRLFQVSLFSGAATVIRESFEVEQLRADLEVVGDTLFFDVWEVDLPDSRIFGEGWVSLSGKLEYDLALRGDPVTTADLWWLIPQLPPGVANLDFRYASLPDGVLLEAQNARWESPDATASGRYAMTLRDRPDGLEFDAVDLEVERVHSTLIASLTGWEPPQHGELAGRVRLAGPLSELEVDGDLRITPDATGASSHVMALGTVHANGEVLGARELEVHFDTLRLDMVRAFVPGLAVRGQVAGSASADGRLSDGMAVSFDIEQSDAERTSNLLAGRATITADGYAPLLLDARVNGEQVSLTTLAEYYPAIPFRGEYRGDFVAVGALDDLHVEVRLGGAEDSLAAIADLQLAEDLPRYSGSLQGWRVGLPEFRRGLPQSDLDFKVEFQGEGIELAELAARGRADVSASFVGGVRLESATVELRVADGRLLVDTSVVAAEFGELHASGALSLSPGLIDSLRFELRADSLAALDPLLFPAFDRLPLPTLGTGATGTVAQPEDVPGLKGSARVVGWLVRDSGYFAVHGAAEAERVAYRDLRADSLRVDDFNIGENAGHFVAGGAVSASGAAFGEIRFDSLEARGSLSDSLLKLEFEVAKPSATAAGRGWASLGKLEQTIGVDSLSLVLRGTRWDLVEPAEFQFEDSGALAIREFELTGLSRRVSLRGAVGVSGPVSLGADVLGLDLANLAVLWPDSLDVAGQVDVHLELSGTVRDPSLQGSIEVAEGNLFGITFSDLRGTFGYESGELFTDAAMWQDTRQQVRLSGTLPLDLELPSFRIEAPERPIDLAFEGDSVPLTLMTLLTDQLTDIRGHARASVHIGGTPEDIDLQGPLTVVNGGFRIPRSGITYEGLEGDLRFDGVRMELDSVSVFAVQGGRGTLTGSVSFANLGNPEFDLRLYAVQLAGYDQFDARIVASGTVTLEGPYDMPHIVGDLSVVSGVLFIEEIGRQAEIIDPFEELRGNLALIDTVFALQTTLGRRTGNRFLDNLVIDLSLNLERDTWLRSEEMNIEIAGRLTLHQDRAQDILRMNGMLHAVRGEYWFFNKRFAVVEGTIELVGEPAMNPNLRIVALYTVRTQKQPIDIRLVIGGTLEEMTLALESDAQPPIPESDLLSYLLFGRPSYELTRTSEESNLLRDATRGVPQAFVGYALGSLLVGESFISYVEVSRNPITPDAEGEYRSGTGPALAATQVEVGWYLAPTVFVSVAQHLVGAVRPTVRLEWRLDDRFTLRGVTEPRFGREGTLFYGGPGTDLEQSIGLFLFYGWAY
ncbi:MAG: translocation/assembly module TamB [Gemmatimonadota bacterium]|nr:MAG: translocation/assembly module TamB [Gemmatimonadota bacterium]